MIKNILILCGLFLTLVLGIISFASAQMGSEVTAIYLYEAAPIGANSTSTCNLGQSSPCLDTDGGYTPTTNGQFSGVFVPMTTYTNPTSSLTANYGYPNYAMCVNSNEVCDATGQLLEVVCGSSIGIPNALAFNAAFPGNFWYNVYPPTTGNNGGEPSALVSVNCATYAANNPTLGLTGTCSAGACI